TLLGSLHDHPSPERLLQRFWEKRFNGSQPLPAPDPKLPQPTTSLEIFSVWRQLPAHVNDVQPASTLSPVAQVPHPVLLWRVRKKSGGSLACVASPQPRPPEADVTSGASRHTCQPSAHRSATLQPVPVALAPSSPAPRLHAGSRVSKGTS